VLLVRSVWSGTVAGIGGFLRPEPPPPIVIGGFGPKMAALAGRIGDGVNFPNGPRLSGLLETARSARQEAGRAHSPFLVTVSSDLRARSLAQLEGLGVDRAVVFVSGSFADGIRRLAGRRG
jgi:alkanesulfonate monooxygenase SsuD/methylene tetrahydromethanopterin reductase-like flavin-dependent oxidoreductase (luciferase family)